MIILIKIAVITTLLIKNEYVLMNLISYNVIGKTRSLIQ